MRKGFALGIVLGAFFGVGLTLLAWQHGWVHGVRAEDADAANMDPNLRLVAQVLAKVDTHAARPPDAQAKQRLVEDMVNAGLARFDPYARYLNTRETKDLDKRMRGNYGGIGALVHTDRKTGLVAVTSPIVGSPAYRGGIQAGDLILKINGRSAEGLTLNEAVDKITGPKGTSVVLSVLHEGSDKPVEIKLVRDLIDVESVLGDHRQPDHPGTWEFMYDKENKIAYVRLVAFHWKSAAELAHVLAQLHNQGMRGLILDLRYNPGGLLDAAWKVANLFLKGDQVITTVRGPNQPDEVYKSKPELSLLPSAKECPMVVLINRYSASASELVSAALQDHGRAIIIGERSFGKGSVQTTLAMNDKGTKLKLTTGSYWRPSGKSINRFPDSKDTDQWGVSPNPGFEVKLKDDERLAYVIDRYQRDMFPSKKAKPNPNAGKKPPFEDRVLMKALAYLRAQLHKPEAKKAA